MQAATEISETGIKNGRIQKRIARAEQRIGMWLAKHHLSAGPAVFRLWVSEDDYTDVHRQVCMFRYMDM